MNVEQLHLETEQETEQLAQRLSLLLAERLPGGGLVFLRGDLGAGKTTLARALLRSYGYQGAVRSPTYTLVERYPTDHFQVCHFDLYRLADPEELEFIGAREDLSEGNLCLVEWPERAADWIGTPDLEIDISVNYFKNGSQVVKNTRQIDLVWHNLGS